jgi:hypothetical protein
VFLAKHSENVPPGIDGWRRQLASQNSRYSAYCKARSKPMTTSEQPRPQEICDPMFEIVIPAHPCPNQENAFKHDLERNEHKHQQNS